MMKNPKNSASIKLQKKKQFSPRSPLKLKNINISSSSSSSSISSEVPKGCLKFFLSNHSSAVYKNASTTKFNCSLANKTPKSAPNFRNFRGNLVKKGSNLQNPEKFGHNLVKKNPNSPHPRKLDQKFRGNVDFQVESCSKVRRLSKRCDFFDGFGGKSSRVEVNFGGNAVNSRKPGSRYQNFDGVEVNVSESCGDFTPVNEIRCGSNLVDGSVKKRDVNLVVNGENCGVVGRSPTPPPVQVSVSPEIQGGSTSAVVGATPTTCYAAGHVMSGVADKRKCRPKGLLTIGGKSLFEISKMEGFRNGGEVVGAGGGGNSRRESMVPSPAEASVYWLSSPCDEKKNEGCDDDVGGNDDVTNDLRLNSCEKLLPFELVGCSSSASSSLGFSSEIFDKSICTVTTSDASSTPCSESSLLHSDLSSEYRGVLGPSLDHLVRCCSPPSSPLAMPTFQVEFSPKQGTSRCDREREASPDLEGSLGSGNVMQTPESNSSPSNIKLFHHSPNSNLKSSDFGLSEPNNDLISRLRYEWELDSVAETLRMLSISPNCHISELDSPRPSFEFNPIVKLDDSFDLTPSQNDIDSSTRESLPEPELRISCKEGSARRLFELDDLDCCRYLTDEEDTGNGSTVASGSHSRV
ncbi:hypothetical protein vseg_004416 [Gypsophila vaccaria]